MLYALYRLAQMNLGFTTIRVQDNGIAGVTEPRFVLRSYSHTDSFTITNGGFNENAIFVYNEGHKGREGICQIEDLHMTWEISEIY
jgi:hypothetical protein